ncbi:MAG: polymerase III subunit epsilon, DNA polymerase III subunit epsilon protein [Candidatus Peregrinibacteria bacterium GW2011_GWF2_38_29]|nr:MAG: polymerase III subunit epsilon, DNA polymerase III subunit epsilon protein [Candidatus Peregrinibacteria bacterium GW2011_GWF2_38_29]
MFIAIDLETTGLDVVADQIIEIGAVKFDKSGIKEEFQTLVNPNIQIPPEVTRITGISNSDLENAPQAHHVTEKLKVFIGDLPFVVHNADFDITILRRAIFEFPNEYFDTITFSQILLPRMRSYSLETLSRTFKLTHEEKHRALSDAKATAALFNMLLGKIKELDPQTLEKIQNLKSNWNGKRLFKI